MTSESAGSKKDKPTHIVIKASTGKLYMISESELDPHTEIQYLIETPSIDADTQTKAEKARKYAHAIHLQFRSHSLDGVEDMHILCEMTYNHTLPHEDRQLEE